MIKFNPYSIPHAICSILLLFFIIFMLARKRKSKLTTLIALWCFSGFIWLFSYTLCYSLTSASLAEIFVRIGCCGVMFLAVFAYDFITRFLELKFERKIVCVVYFINITLLPFYLFTNYFLSGTHKYFYGYYGKAGPFYIYYIIFFFIMIARMLFLMYKRTQSKNLSSKERLQIKYVFVGFLVASGSSIDYLPKFGIPIYPFGCFFMLFWIFVTSYAIMKHQLMDINIAIKRGFVYSILVALITAVYFIFVFLAERLFQGMVGYTSLVVSILYAFVIALFFNPVKNKIQGFADRIFLGRDPVKIAQENELMRQELARSERLKAVSTFASGMAHEIKNPLTAIKTFAEYLPEKKNDPQFLNKFSKIVAGEVGRIDSLVHQLLDFSKPAPLKLQTVNIHNLLDDTLNLLNSEFIAHKIKLKKDYRAINPKIKADSNQLKQAFLNLFLNAMEAMPAGGALTVSTSQNSSDSLSILVQDAGCGIPKEDLPHIFEPFYSKKENGTGLGLSIVYNIIKEHKGNINIKSRFGEWTVFIIEIPILRE